MSGSLLRHDGGSAILRKYPTRLVRTPVGSFSIVQRSQEAQVQRLFQRVGGAAAFAIFTAFVLTGAPQAAAQTRPIPIPTALGTTAPSRAAALRLPAASSIRNGPLFFSLLIPTDAGPVED